MTTPSRIQEILQEMERDPQLASELREKILGQEFSQLPVAVAQNQALIIRLMERQVELSGTTRTALEAVVSSIQQLGEMVTDALETQSQRLGRIEAAQDTMANKLGTLEPAMSELREEQRETRADLRKTDGRLDRGFGANYEAKVTSNIRSILGQQLGIRNSRVLKGPNLRNDEDLEQLLEEAESRGAITEEEADELLLLDLIVAGTQRADHARVYVAAEVSITANQDDVNRAADRADILRRVTGLPSRPVVIADRMAESYRQLADEKEVAVAIYPE
jgi:hypothetical protein